jgi:DNA repair protein RecO (recombination protein O)
MSSFSSPSIVLRKTDFGDYDLIITLFTLNSGKTSVIAKSAKKSTKRFAGILDIFSVLDIVYSISRRKGLPVLQEATLKHPFPEIRSSIQKTAYASYWAELVNEWMESGQTQTSVYRLLFHVLNELDIGRISEAALSILFQMRFVKIAGLSPNLNSCGICRVEMEKIKKNRIMFNLAKGGILCERCAVESGQNIELSKGTVKQLLWVAKGDLKQATRIRFAAEALREGGAMLEAFVPYHLGKAPRSLKFLRQIRG